MSDFNPNENPNMQEDQELFELLDRLEERDKTRRRRQKEDTFYFPETTDLITVDENDTTEADMPLEIGRFQSIALSSEEVHALLIGTEELEEEENEETEEEMPLPAAPQQRRNPFQVLWAAFSNNLPRKEDSTGTKWRKGGFLFSLLVMVVAAVYLLVDLLIIPALNTRLKNELVNMYHPEDTHILTGRDGNYPRNMLASFQDLYDRNPDVRGWISFHAGGNKDFLNIEYPIVYRDVEDKTNPYLKTDFNGNRNKNGTLYFDQQNNVERYTSHSDVLVVYGHNMASGQMFAGLNKFMGSVNNARVAPTLTLSTLFRRDVFKVFAVVLLDESDVNARSMDIWKTGFLTDTAFLEQVEKIRARSLFDYPVDVEADDQLLVLSTCTGKTSAHVKDGRLLVVARRVRDVESAAVETNAIVKNSDVIMPYYWYINQNKKPHQYYTDIGMDQPVSPNLPTVSVATTTTTETVTGDTTDTTATEGEESTTTTVDGEDGGDTTTAKPTEDSSDGTTTAGETTTATKQDATTAGATTTVTAAPTEATTTVTEAPTEAPTTTEPTTAPSDTTEE